LPQNLIYTNQGLSLKLIAVVRDLYNHSYLFTNSPLFGIQNPFRTVRKVTCISAATDSGPYIMQDVWI